MKQFMNSAKSQIEKKVRAVPDGYHTVTPFIIVKGAAQFLDFMANAFGAVELARVPGENDTIAHAEAKIGDSIVMTFDSRPDWPDTPAFVRLYVEDCDVTYQQALKAGGVSVTVPTNMPWGDRGCRIGDPFGNLWWIMTRVEDLKAEEIERRYGQQQYIDAMKYVQSAVFFPLSRKRDNG
jgi:PhnB protein